MTTKFAQSPTQDNIHRSVGGGFKDGTAFLLATGAFTQDVAIYGAGGVRIFGLFATSGGTLVIQTLRWDGTTVYATKPIADITVVAATEFVAECDLRGERGLRFTFTPTGNGTVTYLDVTAASGMGADA